MKQRNLEKSALHSDIHYANILRLFKQSERPVPWFHKIVTKTMITELSMREPFSFKLEFPVPFVKAHREKLSPNATFERVKSDRKWPMRLTLKDAAGATKHRVFVYGGGGWKTFVEENRIEVGYLMIFSLIEPSRFLVHIYRYNPPVGIPAVKDAAHDAVQPAVKEPTDRTVNQNRCLACGRVTTRPQFMTTVSLPHMDVDAGFLVRHRGVLQNNRGNNLILLKGPNKTVMEVQVWKYSRTTYQLDSGWTEFAVANGLKVGDALAFSMVEPGYFKVAVVDRN